jgi:hypothetical protein
MAEGRGRGPGGHVRSGIAPCASCCVIVVVFCVLWLEVGSVFYPFYCVEHLTHANTLYCSTAITNAPPLTNAIMLPHKVQAWVTQHHAQGCVTGNKNGGVQSDLAFILRDKNTHFSTSVHFASMMDNLVLKL